MVRGAGGASDRRPSVELALCGRPHATLRSGPEHVTASGNGGTRSDTSPRSGCRSTPLTSCPPSITICLGVGTVHDLAERPPRAERIVHGRLRGEPLDAAARERSRSSSASAGSAGRGTARCHSGRGISPRTSRSEPPRGHQNSSTSRVDDPVGGVLGRREARHPRLPLTLPELACRLAEHTHDACALELVRACRRAVDGAVVGDDDEVDARR